MAGNIGAETRFEYTVIGDPVNEASRLTDLAEATPGRVLATEAVFEACASDPARADPEFIHPFLTVLAAALRCWEP